MKKFVVVKTSDELPPNPFAAGALENIGAALSLRYFPPEIQVPNLSATFVYQGKNDRPDVPIGKMRYHLSMKGSGEVRFVGEGEKVYLTYNKQKSSYHFHPNPTPLWAQLSRKNDPNVLQVEITLQHEGGALSHSAFDLPCTQARRHRRHAWKLDGQRVDGTLLVRQKARFAGGDLFLQMHGGDEYAHTFGKQRIDFMQEESLYSCFVDREDYLIWKEGRWHVAEIGEDTAKYPLLVVQSIEEKLMRLELWDPEGKSKTLLNLVRSKDHFGWPQLEHEFKFVGAKTWSQFILESRESRVTLKPHDWMLLTQEGWKKIDSEELVDHYVEQKLCGPLFVLEKLDKEDGRQVLRGHLFNTMRTEVQSVALPTQGNHL